MAEDPIKKAKETADIVEDAFRSIAASVKDIFNEALDASDDFGKTLSKDITRNINSIARSSSQLVSNQMKIVDGSLKLSDIEKQRVANLAKIEGIERQTKVANASTSLSKKEKLKYQKALNKQLENAIESNAEITNQLNEQENTLKEINKLSGAYEDLAEGIKSIPGLGPILKGPFEGMAKGAKQTATALATGTKTAGIFGKGMTVAGGAMKGFAKGAASSMLGKAGWIGLAVKLGQLLFNAFNDANKQAVELSRNLGLNRIEAENFKDVFDGLSKGVDDSVATSANLQKAFLASNKVLGFNLQTSLALNDSEKERLVQVNDINERLGLSEQSFSNLVNLSRITGDTEKNILDTINSTVYQVGLQNKMMFNTREILEEVLQTSDSIALQFGFNVKEIAKATAEAKLLGFSLKDIEGTQSNMLNFESSIAAELEAEILTNKELNLERARAFALQGDLLSLGKELNKEIGSFGEFQRMNILQQQSLAKAVGMSREELTNVFKEQEKVRKIQSLVADEKFREYATEQLKLKGIKNITDKAIEGFIRSGELNEKYSKVLGLSLTESLKRETATKRFERLLDKLKETLSRLASSRGIDMLVDYIEKLAYALAGGQSLFSIFLKPFGGIDEASVEAGRSMLTPREEIQQAVEDANSVQPQMATGGIVNRPTRALIGEAGAEAVVPLNEFYAKIDQLIAAVESNRNVYMDGRLVGDAVAARSFK
jgi:hypothetical protein